MNAPPINAAIPGPHQRIQALEKATANSSLTVFTELLEQSLSREAVQESSDRIREDEIYPQFQEPGQSQLIFELEAVLDNADLNLHATTASFDQLGVLVLRAINENIQFLEFEKNLAPDQPKSPQDLLDKHELSNPLSLSIEPTELSFSSASENVLGLGRLAGTAQQISNIHRVLVQSGPLNSSLLQTMPAQMLNLQGRANSTTLISENQAVRSQEVVPSERLADMQNSEIEVVISRSELGLIVLVKAPALDARISKALEQRLSRLVEQSGEKVDRIQFVSSDQQTQPYQFSIVERSDNGSD